MTTHARRSTSLCLVLCALHAGCGNDTVASSGSRAQPTSAHEEADDSDGAAGSSESQKPRSNTGVDAGHGDDQVLLDRIAAEPATCGSAGDCVVVSASRCCGEHDCAYTVTSVFALDAQQAELDALAAECGDECGGVEACHQTDVRAACVGNVCVDDETAECIAAHEQVNQEVTALWRSLELSCEKHGDCTRIWLDTECYPACSDSPVAVVNLERAETEIQTINDELCVPAAERGCAATVLSCEPYATWLPQCEAGTCERVYGCERIEQFITDELATAAEVDQSCESAADCTTATLRIACGGDCRVVAVSSLGAAEFGAAAAELEAALCPEFEATHCTADPEACADPSPAVECRDGECVLEDVD